MSYVLDTNALSEAMKATPSSRVMTWLAKHDDACFLSAVTVGEIERGIELLPESRRKRDLKTFFNAFLASGERVLAFDEPVARRWAKLSAATRRKGRTLPVLDSMIEATALHWDLTVVTRNTGDFAEAKTLDPWKA